MGLPESEPDFTDGMSRDQLVLSLHTCRGRIEELEAELATEKKTRIDYQDVVYAAGLRLDIHKQPCLVEEVTGRIDALHEKVCQKNRELDAAEAKLKATTAVVDAARILRDNTHKVMRYIQVECDDWISLDAELAALDKGE